MSRLRRKWQRWIKTIDREILDSIREDKLIFDNYYALIESNPKIVSPWNFHEWVLNNYGRSLMLQVRKLADSDSRVYSLRRLIGQIAHNPAIITKRAYIAAYKPHHRDIALRSWTLYAGTADAESLPKSVPLRDIELLDRLTRRICNMVNKHIAHLDRRRRVRKTNFDELYTVIGQVVSLAAKYGNLLGSPVADDLNNFVIIYDWMAIFDSAWRDRTMHGAFSKSYQKNRRQSSVKDTRHDI